MIKILCSKRASTNNTVKLIIKDGAIRAELDGQMKGFDVLPKLLPYHSYSLVLHTGGGIVVDGKYYQSDCRWLDLNRLGVASRIAIGDIALIYGTATLIQVDTGVTAEQMVIRVFCAMKNKVTVESNVEYSVESFDPEDYATKPHPRFELWDCYSLKVGDVEYKADCDGNFISGEPVPIPSADIISFTIRKYSAGFGERLTRDIDCEEVFVDSSVGVVDNRRVKLENGVGSFRLITFGYTGSVKIKLGRKWYEVWDDYALEITEAEA